MARNIKVEELFQTPIEKQRIELVERKGIGHPDSISDGLAEAVSRALCREYIDKCGAVLHHNTDETQISRKDNLSFRILCEEFLCFFRNRIHRR